MHGDALMLRLRKMHLVGVTSGTSDRWDGYSNIWAWT